MHSGAASAATQEADLPEQPPQLWEQRTHHNLQQAESDLQAQRLALRRRQLDQKVTSCERT